MNDEPRALGGDGDAAARGTSAPAGGHRRFREFPLTSFALRHKNSVLVGMVVIFLIGTSSYMRIPRESNPEIQIPMFVISTFYTGVAPADVENLVTRPLEEELNTIADVKEITSASVEGYSSITVEFEAEVDLDSALQKVREKVDLARPELPPAAEEPMIFEIDFSDFPIMEVNVAGDYDLVRLKEVAEDLQDKLEGIPSVRQVLLSGGLEREVQINVDLPKLKYYGLDFADIVDAIAFENVTIPGGSIDVGEKKFLVRVPGEFETVTPMEEVVITTRSGRPIYIRDIATVDFAFEDRATFARLDGHSVVTLGVKKRTGENIIETAEAVEAIIAQMLPDMPPSTRIQITSNQAEEIEAMVSELENNIISGLLLVLVVLLFFLGLGNAGLAAISIPLSMLLSYFIMEMIDFSLNFVVLFSLILALGMLVDNAVVVVENIYRYIERGSGSFEAARKAVGEVAMPIVAATLTTLAAFLPIAFWPGIVGEFMKFLPITLIITLSSSLFIALVIIPVLCAVFMRRRSADSGPTLTRFGRRFFSGLAVLIFLAVLITRPLTAVLLLATAALFWLGYHYALHPLSVVFQDRGLPAILRRYEGLLRWALAHRGRMMLGTLGCLILIMVAFRLFSAGQVFFAEDVPPSFAWVQVEAPVGTRVEQVDAITRTLEGRIQDVEARDDIESVVATVGNSSDDFGFGGEGSHLSTISLSFIDFQDLRVDAFDTIERLREDLTGAIVGADVRVEIQQPGPPTGRPIEVEFVGPEFDVLRQLSAEAIAILQRSPVFAKLDGLESDIDQSRPELRVDVDREKAALYGLTTQDIGWTVRSAINGVVASEYRYGDEEIDIRVRLAKPYRNDLAALGDLNVMNDDGRSVPLSSVASWEIDSGLGGINRKDLDRVAMVSADIRSGFNDNAVVAEVGATLGPLFERLPRGYEARFGGQQEDQAEASEFLKSAFMMALMLIAFILISQFNSLTRPLIIISSVGLSTVGVLLGLLILHMPFSIVMTGVGVIALAGIVVNNAIVLIDYIDLLRRRDGMSEIESLVRGGLTRFRPVILTAITTIGGMIPLAIGLNFDYQGLYTRLEPELFWGGESASWWGPLAIAVIFGLAFATFLTLVLVPVMVSLLDDFGRLLRRLFVPARAVPGGGTEGTTEGTPAIPAEAQAVNPSS